MKFNLKAGKYLIIDPCYVFPKDEWADFCHVCRYDDLIKSCGNVESIYPLNGRAAFVARYKGVSFYVIPTNYGDGSYPLKREGQEIARLSVDAGILSIIPLELAQSWPEFSVKNDLGMIVEVKYDCQGFCNNDGDFKFGDFSVKTS